MAIIAFAIAGNLIGGAIGGTIVGGITTAIVGQAIGAAIGSYIDQAFLFPWLFGGNESIQGNRLQDISLQTAQEGAPVKWVLGPKNRIAGNVIWWPGDFIEEKDTINVGSKKNKQSISQYKYAAHFAVDLCKTYGFPVNAIREIWADSIKIYNNGVLDSRVDDITIYRGTTTQMPDPLIESYRGVGHTPAYRGHCYVVFKHFALADWGNRVPNLTFLVEADAQLTVGQAIARILERAGLTSADYDVSRVPGCLQGYVISGPQAPAKILEPLLLAYNLLVQQQNGKLVFFQKGEEEEIAIQTVHLATAGEGETAARPFDMSDVDDRDLPREVTISYADPAFDLQQSSQAERRHTPLSDNTTNYTFPLTFTTAEARILARKILWQAWTERQVIEFRLPPRFLNVLEGDRIAFTYGSERFLVRITGIDRGSNNFLLVCKGVVTESFTDVTEEDPEDRGGTTNPDVYTPPETTLYVLDIPALREVDLDRVMAYAAVCTTTPAARWRGGALIMSSDDTTWEVAETLVVEAVMGIAATLLDIGPANQWDRASTLDITLLNGTLASASEEEVLAGVNHMLVGEEIIAFRSAAQVSPGVYRISNLLRGRRGTESKIASHMPLDRCILLDTSVVPHEMPSTSIGGTRYFRGVPAGVDIGEYASVALSPFQARSLWTFAPCDVIGTRDGSGNLTIAWTPRSRRFTKIFGFNNTPLDTPEAYEIEVYNGSTLIRTLTSATPSVGYTAADQVTDGFTVPGPLIKVRVYSLSPTVGRGWYTEESV